MHAETLASDPSAVRWVSTGSLLPSGRLLSAPGALGALLTNGTLSEVTTEPHGLTMWLAPGRSWRVEGDAIRQALTDALEKVGDWIVEIDEDGVLRSITADVLAGPVGDYVRGHGGTVSIVGAADGILDVVFDGACSRCPS